MKCLIIGSNGNIGKGLFSDSSSTVAKKLVSCSRRSPADIILEPRDLNALHNVILTHNLNSIFLLSAISNPGLCGPEYNSNKVNIQLPILLASFCKEHRLRFVFASTEYVYNGDCSNQKSENPLSVLPATSYALEKLSAEYLISSILPEALILRLPKVYQRAGTDDLLSWMRRDAMQHETIRIANDQYFSPISCHDLGQILILALENNLTGVYNCGGPDAKSRLEYYEIYREYFPFHAHIMPLKMSELGIPEHIPRNVTMDSSKIYIDTNYTPRSFRCFIEKYLI
jgi:dTDP-4-dehydrorhamnose reductase